MASQGTVKDPLSCNTAQLLRLGASRWLLWNALWNAHKCMEYIS